MRAPIHNSLIAARSCVRAGWATSLRAFVVVSFLNAVLVAVPASAQRYAIGTAGSGGVFQIFGGAIAQIAQEAIPGLSMTVVATQGSAENSTRVGRGDLQFGLAGNDAAYNAYRGGPGFPQAFRDLRVVMAGHKAYLHLLTAARSSIRDWKDLVGRRVALTSPTSPNFVAAMAVLAEYGVSQGDLSPQWITSSGYADGIRNGTLDAGSLQTGYPAPAVTELCASRVGVRLLEVPQAVAVAVSRKYPFFEPGVIPGGAYSCISEPVPTIATTTLLIVHKDVPDGVVYALVKAIIEGGYLAQVHPAGREWALEKALSGLAGIPLHPGAERYFRDRGVLR